MSNPLSPFTTYFFLWTTDMVIALSLKIPPLPSMATCAYFASLLQYASLRGADALHNSSLSSLPRAVFRLLQRRPISGPRDYLESLVYRMATLWQPAHASRRSPFADRYVAE